MLARINEKGKYIKDVKYTQKIQGTQFDKIVRGIVESKLYGYTLIEIMPYIDPKTGKLAEVNLIERRNVLPDQYTVVKRQGIWLPNWNIASPAYNQNYILINSGTIGLFSATTPLILAKNLPSQIMSTLEARMDNRLSMGRPSQKVTATVNAWRTILPMPHKTKW